MQSVACQRLYTIWVTVVPFWLSVESYFVGLKVRLNLGRLNVNFPTIILANFTCKSPFRKFKVARYSFTRSIPPEFERKLRRHKQRFGKIDTTVVVDKDETLL